MAGTELRMEQLLPGLNSIWHACVFQKKRNISLIRHPHIILWIITTPKGGDVEATLPLKHKLSRIEAGILVVPKRYELAAFPPTAAELWTISQWKGYKNRHFTFLRT